MSEEEFNKEVAIIDHRSEASEVLNTLISAFNLTLEYELTLDTCTLKKEKELYHLPLTCTKHDRYVIISSVAEILKNDYTFYLSDNSIEDDTHYIKIFPSTEKRNEIKIWEYTFIPLKKGYDYFNGIDVPYINHDDNNPNFDWEANQLANQLSLIRPCLVKQKLRQIKEGKQETIEDIDDDPSTGKLGRDLRIKLGTASAKDKLSYYGSRYWWLLIILVWYYL